MARAHIDRTDTSDHLDPLYRAYKAGLVNGVGHAWTPNEADDDEKVWPEFIAWKVDQ